MDPYLLLSIYFALVAAFLWLGLRAVKMAERAREEVVLPEPAQAGPRSRPSGLAAPD